MELSQIHNFLALAEGGSMSATAERMGISQPSLSRSIATLEKELGTKLFDRRNGGVFLNEYGREFLPYARTARDSLFSGILNVKRDIYTVKGGVFIVCQAFSDSINSCVADYIRLNPEAQINVYNTEPDASDMDKIDFFFTPVMPRRTMDRENVWESCLLQEEEFCLAMSPRLRDFPEGKDVLTPGELRDIPFVTMPMSNYFYRDITYSICESSGFAPRVACCTTDFQTKTAMVDEGVAAAFYPECCLRVVKLLAPEARIYRIEGYKSARRLYLTRQRKSLMSETAKDFWNFALDHFNIPDPTIRV
ncbi:MAG: LysR family transcriptional regulator [Oscillospiraceae bacterium]|nr:LysR family transcriptional regulator [Oscillospiraceae bacterium]